MLLLQATTIVIKYETYCFVSSVLLSLPSFSPERDVAAQGPKP